jgi:zinc finger protein 830
MSKDVRQLMKKQIAERKSKVDSPFAKYNSAGQLQCSLCGTPVKTEALWPVHVKSKTHKENQARLEQPQKKAPSKAAPAPQPTPPPSSDDTKRDREEEDKDLMPPPPTKKVKETPVSTPSGLPAGFFDAYGDNEDEKETEEEEEGDSAPQAAEAPEAAPTPAPAPAKSSLPAGFFDDPTMDAEARGAKTPAKLKEEAIDKAYERYQESLGEDLKNSEKIQVEDLLKDESVDVEGDSEIVDREHERRLREEKMLELKKKAERVKELKQKISQSKRKEMDVGDDDLISPDAFYDWRAKSSKLNS